MKKAALICAMVLMISILPAFALNQTANNTTAQVQDQSGTCDQTQAHSHEQNQNCQKDDTCPNCTTSDGDQHKYQYGLKNGNNGNNNRVEQANCPKN